MSNETARDTAILIPSYQPDEKLPAYVQALRGAGFGRIVVVDDGSGADYDAVYQRLGADDVVRVLRYTPNRGKGNALRTGMRFIQDECPDARYIVTADSDGQHTVKDTLRMVDALREDANGLLLGSRDFSQPDVPPKSKAGNRITTVVFRLLYGQYVGDTQTGLRGFERALLPRFIATKGDRYEYEMNQLIDCASAKIPIRALPIETVYENNNAGSHFNPVKDSARIYRVILGRFFRFITVSLICFCVDYGLFLLFNTLLERYVPSLEHEFRFLFLHFVARIGVATLAGRIVSSCLNFALNKKLVFASRSSFWRTFPRYVCTVLLIVVLSAGLTSTLYLLLGWNENLVKMPVDIALFFLSYYIQRVWVFSKKGEPLPDEADAADRTGNAA